MTGRTLRAMVSMLQAAMLKILTELLQLAVQKAGFTLCKQQPREKVIQSLFISIATRY